jgi:hypothetical protein
MNCVRLEPTIPASERVQTLHALDRSATVTGINYFNFKLPLKQILNGNNHSVNLLHIRDVSPESCTHILRFQSRIFK